MCKEMPVVPVNQVVGMKKNNRKKGRAKEEETHKGTPTSPPPEKQPLNQL
jgi:hypothetical protein